jgi:hypothetical protein
MWKTMKLIRYSSYFIIFISIAVLFQLNTIYSIADDNSSSSPLDLKSIIPVLPGTAAAIFAAIALRKNSKVNEAQIYLSLRNLFSKHEEIQKNLKGGKWNERYKGPSTELNSSEESAKVDSYLRFFEYCYVLIENKVINPKTFKEMYGPYIYDIKKNHQIMQTIEEEGWILFPKLLNRLDNLNK